MSPSSRSTRTEFSAICGGFSRNWNRMKTRKINARNTSRTPVIRPTRNLTMATPKVAQAASGLVVRAEGYESRRPVRRRKHPATASPSRTSEHEAGSGVSSDSIHAAEEETLVSAKNCPKEELRDGDAEG